MKLEGRLTRKSGKHWTGIRCSRMLIRSRSSGGVGAGSVKLEHRQFFVFEFLFVFGSWVARRKYICNFETARFQMQLGIT